MVAGARNYVYYASIMLNAFNPHYAQNYASIANQCKPNGMALILKVVLLEYDTYLYTYIRT